MDEKCNNEIIDHSERAEKIAASIMDDYTAADQNMILSIIKKVIKHRREEDVKQCEERLQEAKEINESMQ